MSPQPFIVGIGGTTSPGSSTERALALALAAAERKGARVLLLGSASISQLPHYGSNESRTSPAGRQLVEQVRAADGLIIAGPGYHGSVSGLMKNAIDYLEETSRDERVYLDGLPVGLISTAYGWQAAVGTMATLRAIVHSLRGWPTPLGGAINASGGIFKDGACSDAAVTSQLDVIGSQVYEFALLRMRKPGLFSEAEAPLACAG